MIKEFLVNKRLDDEIENRIEKDCCRNILSCSIFENTIYFFNNHGLMEKKICQLMRHRKDIMIDSRCIFKHRGLYVGCQYDEEYKSLDLEVPRVKFMLVEDYLTKISQELTMIKSYYADYDVYRSIDAVFCNLLAIYKVAAAQDKFKEITEECDNELKKLMIIKSRAIFHKGKARQNTEFLEDFYQSVQYFCFTLAVYLGLRFPVEFVDDDETYSEYINASTYYVEYPVGAYNFSPKYFDYELYPCTSVDIN